MEIRKYKVMKSFKIFLFFFVFSPLLCFAETSEFSDESVNVEYILQEADETETILDNSAYDTDNDNIPKNDSIIFDIQSYYKLKEKYDSLFKELTKDKDAKISEIKNREETAIFEIENYPWTTDELDENGEPTETALKYREENINAIKERFKAEYSEVETESIYIETEEMVLTNAQIQAKLLEITEKEYLYFDFTENEINYSTKKSYDEFTNIYGIIDEGFIISPGINILKYPYLKYSLETSHINKISSQAFSDEIIETFKNTGTFPFYSEGIFTISYDELDNTFTVTLVKQNFYLLEDNSIIDITIFKTKVEEESTQKEQISIIEDSEEETDKEKSKQQGRNGIYIDGSFGFGPYGNIFSARTQFLFGGKFAYAGLSVTGQFHTIDSKFNSSYDNFIMLSAGAVLGATIHFWKLQPYVQLGGGYANPFINSNKTIDTFNANAEAGIDVHLSKFAIGVFYKFDYFLDCGATDSFGISFGYRF